MPPTIIIAFFALGAIIASFIGVVVGRMHTGQSFLTGRSRCDACGRPLEFFALVPLLSFFASRGRAQCCGARVSWLSPLSEALLALLFALAYLQVGLSIVLLLLLTALSLLLALVLYDLAHQILPPMFLYPFVAASAATAYLAAPSLQEFSSVLLTAVGIGSSLAAIHLFSRGRAMGLADAPLAAGLALLAGPVALTGFVFSFWIGAIVGIALLVRRPRGSRMGVEVPFAPFLAAGFLLAYFTAWNLFTYIVAVSGN